VGGGVWFVGTCRDTPAGAAPNAHHAAGGRTYSTLFIAFCAIVTWHRLRLVILLVPGVCGCIWDMD